MPKRFLIAANWKMNSPPPGFDASDSPYCTRGNVDVVVFPTYVHLQSCIDAELETGAQHGHPEKSGAYTGDVSMHMLQEIGCSYVLCGHSERRHGHSETDEQVAAQVEAALAASLIPVLCVGETKREKEAGKGQDAVQRQLSSFRPGCIIAYEPVWAISGGDANKNAASAEDARNMHTFIRTLLPEQEKNSIILYGGSMKGANAEELLSQPHIDGGLIGGASLKPKEFATIVEAAAKLAKN